MNASLQWFAKNVRFRLRPIRGLILYGNVMLPILVLPILDSYGVIKTHSTLLCGI